RTMNGARLCVISKEWGEAFDVGAGIGYSKNTDERYQSGGGGEANGPNPPFPAPNISEDERHQHHPFRFLYRHQRSTDERLGRRRRYPAGVRFPGAEQARRDLLLGRL